MLRRIKSVRWSKSVPNTLEPRGSTSVPLTTGVKPAFSYVGSKARLVDWIVPLFPEHTNYVEVFGGSGAVLLAKQTSPVEVYNDLDDHVVNFYRVLHDPAKAEALVRALDLTPYARTEHRTLRASKRNLPALGDEIEQARAYYTLVQQSFSGRYADSWSTAAQPGKNKTKLFRQYRTKFGPITERLDGVTIDNDTFQRVIPRYDTPGTLYYLDPPYVYDTRSNRSYYANDCMDDEQHVELLDLIENVAGKVVLSGYDNRIYSQRLKGWRRAEKPVKVTNKGGSKVEVEVLWMNF